MFVIVMIMSMRSLEERHSGCARVCVAGSMARSGEGEQVIEQLGIRWHSMREEGVKNSSALSASSYRCCLTRTHSTASCLPARYHGQTKNISPIQ